MNREKKSPIQPENAISNSLPVHPMNTQSEKALETTAPEKVNTLAPRDPINYSSPQPRGPRAYTQNRRPPRQCRAGA